MNNNQYKDNKNIYEEAEITKQLRPVTKAGNKDTIVVSDDNPESLEQLNTLLMQHIAKKFEEELKTTEIKRGSKIEEEIQNNVIEFLNKKDIRFNPISLKQKAIRNFMLGLSGYGVLQPLMDDEGIEDIYIYGPNKIYYLKNGVKQEAMDISFESPEKLKSFIDNLLGRINRTVNNKNPIEDGRMPDGSRIAISSDVLSPQGTTMNIRKFRKEGITLKQLAEKEAIDDETVELLKGVVKSRLNYIVSGGTSSGKTTMLNAMAQFITPSDNVISIEDNIELQLNRDFWLQLESRKSNLEGAGEVTMEDLLVHVLRRSPDRIVIGEIRTGGVADTFMNAIQTGHDGTSATVHANNPERCRARMCKLASVASKQPLEASIEDFNNSINIIIQLKRSELLKRRVCESITFVNPSGELSPLVVFDYDTRKFVHYELPDELKKVFKEYGVKYEHQGKYLTQNNEVVENKVENLEQMLPSQEDILKDENILNLSSKESIEEEKQSIYDAIYSEKEEMGDSIKKEDEPIKDKQALVSEVKEEKNITQEDNDMLKKILASVGVNK